MFTQQTIKPAMANQPDSRREMQQLAAPVSDSGRRMEPQGGIGNQAVTRLLQRRVAANGAPGAGANRFLQRKCACGGTSGMTGESEECRKKKIVGLQTKLRINEPGDIYEQEADRVADQVLAMPVQPGFTSAPTRIQGYKGQGADQIDAAPSSVDRALASPGRPLEATPLQDMEQRFGYDFSSVRVHTDTTAAESAHAVSARAYTMGYHIVFGQGQYTPQTSAGKKLLAHELTHVLQQSGGDGFSPGLSPSGRYPSLSGQQPDGMADGARKRMPIRSATASAITLQRDATDDLADYIARDLNDYVAKNPSPYEHIIEVFHYLNRHDRDKEDNVAAAFLALQPDAKLEEFASAKKGRDMLDVLYEAMITGDVSSFESLQSERILIAKAKWISPQQYAAEVERIARLRHKAEDNPTEFVVDLGASKTAHELNDDVAKRQYGNVIKKIHDLSASDEDNVASHFIELQPPAKLDEFAASKEGRAMLDILYEAIITGGDVTDFERLQAERILKAKRRYIDPKQYREMIFPISDPIFGENAVFVAELKGGKVHLRYMTRGLYRDSKFREEAKTLPDDLSQSDLILDPDDVVRVKLYDQGEITVTVQAIQLIDFSNQGLQKFKGRVETTVWLALTLPAGAGALGGSSVRALAAAVEAGEASKVALAVEALILWADRAAFVLQLTSLVVNANRNWILKKFPKYGGAFLAALDQVDGFVSMYGWGRMGLDGFRLIRGKISPALENWRREAAARKQLSASEQATVKGIGDQLDSFVGGLAPGEAVASINEHPNEHPIKGNPGERHAPVKDGHKVVELRDAKGIHCEYHSPDNPIIPCPHGMGGAAPATVEPAPPQKTDEPVPKEKAREPAATPHPDEPIKKPPPVDVGTGHIPPASAPIDPKKLTQRLAENEKRIAEIDRQSQIHEQRRRDYLEKAKRLEDQKSQGASADGRQTCGKRKGAKRQGRGRAQSPSFRKQTHFE